MIPEQVPPLQKVPFPPFHKPCDKLLLATVYKKKFENYFIVLLLLAYCFPLPFPGSATMLIQSLLVRARGARLCRRSAAELGDRSKFGRRGGACFPLPGSAPAEPLLYSIELALKTLGTEALISTLNQCLTKPIRFSLSAPGPILK